MISVWQTDIPGAIVRSVCFDGQLVWATVMPGRGEPRLLVLDPVSGQQRYLTSADGLPAASGPRPPSMTGDNVLVAPLRPGKVFACGAFGRTWLGTIECRLPSEVKVDVIHEARELDVPSTPNTVSVFAPRYLFPLTDSALPASDCVRRVLVGRNLQGALVVDLQTRAVAVVGEYWHAYPRSVHGNAVYWSNRFANGATLLRNFPPDPKSEPVQHDLPEGLLFIINGELHVIRDRWWHATDLRGPLRLVCESTPWPERLARHQPWLLQLVASSHYGLLVHCEPEPYERERPLRRRTYQATWRDTTTPAPAEAPASVRQDPQGASQPFVIMGIGVHRPPLARDASECMTP